MIEERKQIKLQIEGTRSERIKKKLQEEYVTKDESVKKQLRHDKRQWMDNLLKDAEEAASKGHIKTLYSIKKVVCNDQAKPCGAIKDKNGKFFSSESERLERWKQHF